MLELRPYQRRSIDEGIYGYFASHATGNPVLAIPTGAGKSLIAAKLLQETLERWPTQRMLVLAHVKELVSQNYLELIGLWPQAPAGIYSAGLNRREARAQLLFASIQSVAHRAHEIGWVDLVIVDEAHMLPFKSSTRYRTFLDALRQYNPNLRVVGMTATPYRLDGGTLIEGDNRLFTDVSIDLTQGDELVNLIDDGYLSPLRTKSTTTTIDVSHVHMRGNEFMAGELEAAVGAGDIIEAGLDEAIGYGKDRAAWLMFFPGVATAQRARDYLRGKGVAAECVHGELPQHERDRILADFKSGAVRAVTNCDILTTGFNHPAVDLLGVFRPTGSAALHVQIIGRGMRRAPGKADCLVLDYAGNTARHGPINRIVVPRKRRKGDKPGEPPTKTCPKCAEIIFIGAMICPACGYEFPKPEPDIAPRAATDKIVARAEDLIEKLGVVRVLYSKHANANGESLKVSYDTGLKHFHEWVLIGRAGGMGRKAAYWWRARSLNDSLAPPDSVDDAVERAPHELRRPGAVVIDHNGKYPQVIAHDFTTLAEGGSALGRLPLNKPATAHAPELPDMSIPF